MNNDMKSIEERAKEYAQDPFIADLERKAYIAGAKDQQYIDRLFIEQLIDKACEWIKENVEGGVHPQSVYGFVERFRKSMEESL